jgi:alpha-tubulin suppressor-like RCC1 family protein
MRHRWFVLAVGACAIAVACTSFSGDDEPVPAPNDGAADSDLDATQPDAAIADAGPDADAGCSIVSLAAGDFHTCAVKADGTVWCWGHNGAGQLGIGNNAAAVARPTRVIDVTDAVEVATGSYHSCARTRSGTVWCWGANNAGQLGNGTIGTPGSPARVTIVDDAKAIAVGTGHSCAIRASDSVWCWGTNQKGQLGNGGFATTAIPVKTMFPEPARSISLGVFHSCAVAISNAGFCWGDNTAGQLGIGFDTDPDAAATSHPKPTAVGNNFGDLVAGGGHTCAETLSGLKCWGTNGALQLGIGPDASSYALPTSVTNASALMLERPAAGYNATCATSKNDSTSWCWGSDVYGLLQDAGPTTGIPVRVNPGDVLGIAVGARHVCANMKNGPPQCWGTTEAGQLGGGIFEPDASTPTRFGPAPVVAICE